MGQFFLHSLNTRKTFTPYPLEQSMLYIYLRGFTLIEVLISLILLSLLLLGFDAMEIDSLRSTRAAYYFYLATQQLIAMTDRLRALGANQSLNEQVAIWNLQNQDLLPAGRGTVSGSYPSYILAVYWGKFLQECKQIKLGQSGCVQQRLQL